MIALDRFSKNPNLFKKRYKHFRNVLASQGYLAGAGVLVGCVCYDLGSVELKKVAAQTVIYFTPFGVLVIVGKALTIGRKLGKVYHLGTMAYNFGMGPFKVVNAVCQAPFVFLDMAVLGHPHIPNLNATIWNIGNITDDMETLADRA